MRRLLAHSRSYGAPPGSPGRPFPHYWDDHSLETGELGRDNVRQVAPTRDDLVAAAEYGGYLHDLGKAPPLPQALLAGGGIYDAETEEEASEDHVRHEAYGSSAALASGNALAGLAIAGHHRGLPDEINHWLANCRFVDTASSGITTGYCMERIRQEAEAFGGKAKELLARLKKMPKYPLPAPPSGGLSDFDRQMAFFVDLKIVFGCLVRADHDSTREFIAPGWLSQKRAARKWPEWDESLRMFEAAANEMEQAPKFGHQAMVHEQRKICRQLLERRREQDPRLLAELSGATGIGKTLLDLITAFYWAWRYNKTRIIFAEPYLTILRDSNNKILRYQTLAANTLGSMGRILDPGGVNDMCLEHYTGGLFRQFSHQRMGADSWDYPIILTTHTRLVEMLFSRYPQDAKLFPALCNSIIIIDEPHLLPWRSSIGSKRNQTEFSNIQEATMAVLRDLARRHGALVLTSSATLPQMSVGDRKRRSMRDLRLGRKEVSVLVPPAQTREMAEVMGRRVKYVFESGLLTARPVPTPLPTVASWVREQTLVKMNTKRLAYLMYIETLNLFKDGSTKIMYGLKMPRHNLDTLDECTRRLRAGLPSRLTATSTIECGVDISYPHALCQNGALENDLQLAGRENRNFENESAIMTIFTPAGFSNKQLWSSPYQAWQAEALLTALRGKTPAQVNTLMNDPTFFRKIHSRCYDDPIKGVKGRNNSLLMSIMDFNFGMTSKKGRTIAANDARVLILEHEDEATKAKAYEIRDAINSDRSFGDSELCELSVGLYKGNDDDRGEVDLALEKGLIRGTNINGIYIAEPGAYDAEIGLRLYA